MPKSDMQIKNELNRLKNKPFTTLDNLGKKPSSNIIINYEKNIKYSNHRSTKSKSY